jgi:hypothetical protein
MFIQSDVFTSISLSNLLSVILDSDCWDVEYYFTVNDGNGDNPYNVI